MKNSMIILGICAMTTLTACQNNLGRDDVQNERSNALSVNDATGDIYNRDKNGSEDFGYVRHKKDEMARTQSQNHYAAIDREKVADIIGEYCTDVPNVDDISTLVTDEEVLIVYHTDSSDRNLTADQVKRMAMSVIPRWYHVYVSDNEALRPNVENFANLGPNSANTETGINQLIKQMLSSPQGKSMSTGENANGEAQGELNEDMDKDDISQQMKAKMNR
ncbi:YhcN/YlaJ family sporulation lipoprotein [Robertmurraya sp. P23]|uniref:YhcN/YlaJ family sporulation lipoprotein n=1 Tax=Robertmurraya sp. P23 TaxID=3436931 RepID=UPI003D9534C6